MFFKPRFTYYAKLEPRMWDADNHMRPDVRVAILTVINQILDEIRKANIPFDMSDIRDVWVHGSITNYYYNKQSDIDICVGCDFERISRALPGVVIHQFLKTMAKASFAHMVPLVAGRNLDFSFVDVRYPKYAPGYYKVGGAYSVLTNKWIRENIKLSGADIKQMCRDAYPLYRDMVMLLSSLLYDDLSADYIDSKLDEIQKNRRVDYDTNYIQPVTAKQIAFRMVRATGMIARARERALKLRAKKAC